MLAVALNAILFVDTIFLNVGLGEWKRAARRRRRDDSAAQSSGSVKVRGIAAIRRDETLLQIGLEFARRAHASEEEGLSLDRFHFVHRLPCTIYASGRAVAGAARGQAIEIRSVANVR